MPDSIWYDGCSCNEGWPREPLRYQVEVASLHDGLPARCAEMNTELTTESEALFAQAQQPATEAPAHTAKSISDNSRRRHIEWAVPLALAVLMLTQLWTSVVQLSITSDEIDHLHAGYRYLQCNDFGWNPEHPPLVKMVAALPLLFMHVSDPIPNACGLRDDKAADFIAGHAFVFANRETVLTAARFSVSLFAVLLLLSVWFFARKLFGLPVAIVCGILVAFDPTFLAHGALVTTDVAASLGILLAVYALYCYVVEPNRTRLLALGLATGFALCTKHSTILLAVILPALLLFDMVFFAGRWGGRRLLKFSATLLAVAAIALTVLWASYGFRYAARPAGAAIWHSTRLSTSHGMFATRIIPAVDSWHLIPESYLAGLQDVLVESELGRPSFLLGKLYRNGNWFYFPVAATIKFTVPILLLVLISAWSVSFWKSRLRELLFLSLPVVVFLAFSMSSKLSVGIRHLLPVLPFLVLFAGAGVWNVASSRRWAMVILITLLIFHVGSSLHAYPNYLSYSNEFWGGPSETYRHLANSDVDWGQGQKMALAYINKTHPSNCFFLRTYNNKNSDYGIPCGGISELQWDPLQTPFVGTMIVSSSMVDGIGVRGASVQTYHVFRDLTPVAKLAGSALLVYQGTIDVSPIVAAQLLVRAREVGEQDPQQGLELAMKAAALDPLSGDAHAVICGSYHALGELAKAEQECNIGLALVRKDPQYSAEQVDRLKYFISEKGLRIYSNQ